MRRLNITSIDTTGERRSTLPTSTNNSSLLPYDRLHKTIYTLRKNWTVKDKHIIFYSESDLAKFNSYLGSIQTFAGQQEQLRKSSFDAANQIFEALKSSTKRQ